MFENVEKTLFSFNDSCSVCKGEIGSYCICLVLFTLTINTYSTVFYFPILHPDLCIIFFNIRPTCEMGLWVELKEEEQRKGVEG